MSKKNSNGSDSNYQVPNLERALVIMEALLEHSDGLGISDISKAMGYPTNSVFRIMNTLHKYDYVHRDESTKKYTLSNKLCSMSYGSNDRRNLMENSLDIMRELRDIVKETTVISILDREEGLVLEQIPGVHQFRFVCDPGTRQVIHTSASTKAIMAYMPKHERNAILKNLKYEPFTSRTVTSKEAFLKELEFVLEHGYAVDRGEALDGVHCVAAPVRDASGKAIASITITGPATRMPEDEFPRFGEIMMEYTARISRRFGFGLVNGNGNGNGKHK